MADKRVKPEQFVTPAGVFVFPKLGEPDTKFKDEGEYSVKLRLSAEAAAPLLAKLEPLHEAALEKGRGEFAKLPVASRKKLQDLKVNPLFSLDYDEDENETGDLLFNFKMTASGVSKKTGKPWTRAPRVFDAAKNVMDGSIVWGGTVGKVAFTVNPYFVSGQGTCGLSLRLEAVQVIDLVSGGQRNADAYGFGEEDGYVAEKEVTETEDTDADVGDF